MIERLENLNDHIDRLAKWVIIAAMMLMPAIMAIQVTLRYIFNYPLGWAEEAVRSIFVWLVFMSACAALRRGELIAMDFVVKRLASRVASVLIASGRVCILFFLGITAYYGYDLTAHVFFRGTDLPTIPVPLWVLYISLPLGCLFMAFQVVLSLIHQRHGTTPRPPKGGGLAERR